MPQDIGPAKLSPPGASAAAAGGMRSGFPPRQSSDSTLHPEPSGRPSSAPSCRSSFDSSADSRRQSLDDGSPALPARSPASQAATLGPAAAARLGAQRGTQQGSGSGPEASSQGPSELREHLLRELGSSSPFGPQAQPQPSSRGTEGESAQRAALLSGLAGRSTARLHGERRRRTGKHPANLEHCSTEPPGAIDELAELLLAAANLAVEGSAAKAASSARGSSGMDSSRGGDANVSPAAPQYPTADSSRRSHQRDEERGPPPVRSSAPAAADAEPLLSSKVALLAQQLLLQQQQQHHGGVSAAQLRGSMDAPLRRSRTVAADEMLRGRQGAPTAADLLRGLAGSGGSGPQASVEATPVLQSLDAAHQPRFSGPSPLESPEQGSPFSAIQGEQQPLAVALLSARQCVPGACPSFLKIAPLPTVPLQFDSFFCRGVRLPLAASQRPSRCQVCRALSQPH